MVKRGLLLLLCAALALSLLPKVAAADTKVLTIDVAETGHNLLDGQAYYGATYTTATNTLTLKNNGGGKLVAQHMGDNFTIQMEKYTLVNNVENGVALDIIGDVTIRCTGQENFVRGGGGDSACGLQIRGNLTYAGPGTLYIGAYRNDSLKNASAIKTAFDAGSSEYTLRVAGGVLVAGYDLRNISYYGVSCAQNTSIVVDSGAELQVYSVDRGISCSGAQSIQLTVNGKCKLESNKTYVLDYSAPASSGVTVGAGGYFLARTNTVNKLFSSSSSADFVESLPENYTYRMGYTGWTAHTAGNGDAGVRLNAYRANDSGKYLEISSSLGVGYTLTNLTTTGASSYDVNSAGGFACTLAPSGTGFILPAAKSDIAVTTGGVATTDFTYDSATGAVTIAKNAIKGDISVTAAARAKDFGITLSPGALDFGDLKQYTAAPAAKTVTVTNNGNVPVQLNPITSAAYTIGAYGSDTLASGASTTFTVRPNMNIAAGVHDEAIAVETAQGTRASVNAHFFLGDSNTLGVTVSPNAEFWQGYPYGDRVVTIGHGISANILGRQNIAQVTMDKNPLTEGAQYTSADGGSILVTLPESYLATLSPDVHWLEITIGLGANRCPYAGQKVYARFEVKDPLAGQSDADVPKTGDGTPILLLAGAAAVCAAVLLLRRAKRRKDSRRDGPTE